MKSVPLPKDICISKHKRGWKGTLIIGVNAKTKESVIKTFYARTAYEALHEVKKYDREELKGYRYVFYD